jgi:hypothetical protein
MAMNAFYEQNAYPSPPNECRLPADKADPDDFEIDPDDAQIDEDEESEDDNSYDDGEIVGPDGERG